MDIMAALASFLGGGFLTAIIFVVGYTNKITALSTKVEALTIALNAHVTSTTPMCSAHQQISERLAVLKAKVEGQR